jgi:membrane protease YdiL (CAAX protease family)
MLFLLKRRGSTGLVGLAVLSALGLGSRALVAEPTPFGLSAENVLMGVAVGVGVLCSDGLLHGLFLLLFGAAYRHRHRQLVEVFRGQTLAAMVMGALMAGVGEELVFRGLGTDPVYLGVAAVVFGLLHHLQWPFTLWAVYEGLLFALALWLTGALVVTMVAHFLHDLVGFLVFSRQRTVTSR